MRRRLAVRLAMSTVGSDSLRTGFLHCVEHNRVQPALEVAGQTLSYGELYERAAAIAATIQERAGLGAAPLTAVFASRSVTAFAGVLGSLLAGNGYVPLNPSFPPSAAARCCCARAAARWWSTRALPPSSRSCSRACPIRPP